MNVEKLATTIIMLIDSADQKIEHTPESDWQTIASVLMNTIRGLCANQLIEKSSEAVRMTDIRWIRANGSIGTFSSSNDEEIEEKVTGLFFLSIQGKIHDLTIEH